MKSRSVPDKTSLVLKVTHMLPDPLAFFLVNIGNLGWPGDEANTAYLATIYVLLPLNTKHKNTISHTHKTHSLCLLLDDGVLGEQVCEGVLGEVNFG